MMTIDEAKVEMDHIRAQGYTEIREMILDKNSFDPFDCVKKTLDIMQKTEERVNILLSEM